MKTKTLTILLTAFCTLAAAATLTAAAADSPGVRVLDSLQNAYQPVTFDHDKHATIAGSCAACHHEHSMGDGLPCKECHGLTPAAFKNSVARSFTACKNCHADFDRDNPGMPGLKTAYHRKCFTCHRGMGEIGTDPKGCTEICHAKAIQRR